MSDTTSSQLGEYGGRTYYLTVSATPSFNTIEDFAVVVHYQNPHDGETIQIARIDTEHGYTHFDKLYRRDQPKEPLDVDIWEAARLLEENWRRYARNHDQMH